MGKINRLIAIYDKVPKIHCQGLCFESCGPLQMQKVEYERLGKPVWTSLTCPLLVDNSCSNYDNRPLVCRLWGVDIAMPCPFGCVIEGEPIDGTVLLKEARRVDPAVRPTHQEIAEVIYREVLKDDPNAAALALKACRVALEEAR